MSSGGTLRQLSAASHRLACPSINRSSFWPKRRRAAICSSAQQKGLDRTVGFPHFPVRILAHAGKTCGDMFEPRLRAILRPRPAVVAKQRRHDLLWGPHVGVDRIHRRQCRHAAIARPLGFVEGGHTLRIRFDQRHALAIGRENQQLAFFFGRRRGQTIQERLGLTLPFAD